MKTTTLMLVRVTVGLLILLWGVDKIVDPGHGVGVSERFYLGAFSREALISTWGFVQTAIGGLTILGLLRRFTYPLVIAMNAVSFFGVWRSIIDPWGWFLDGTNVLFFPSSIVLAASLLLYAFMNEDATALDHRRPAKETDMPEVMPEETAAGV